MDKKKWSCPHCTYGSGRFSNVKRHIGRKHDDGAPIQNPEYGSKSHVRCLERSMGRAYSNSTQHYGNRKARSSTFADNYQFEDKRLKALKDFGDALRLEEGPTKDLIMTDIYKRVEGLSFSQSPWAYLALMGMSSRISNYPLREPPIQTPKLTKEEEFLNVMNSGTIDSLPIGKVARRNFGYTPGLNKPRNREDKFILTFERLSKLKKEREETDKLLKVINEARSKGLL